MDSLRKSKACFQKGFSLIETIAGIAVSSIVILSGFLLVNAAINLADDSARTHNEEIEQRLLVQSLARNFSQLLQTDTVQILREENTDRLVINSTEFFNTLHRETLPNTSLISLNHSDREFNLYAAQDDLANSDFASTVNYLTSRPVLNHPYKGQLRIEFFDPVLYKWDIIPHRKTGALCRIRIEKENEQTYERAFWTSCQWVVIN